MQALISADMEGATGVTCADDCDSGTWQFARFQPIFTADVNAVALGFFDAGVDDVVVTDSHGSMRNLLLEQLDPRVQMITGRHKTYPMLAGIEDRPDLVAFVGYHSAAGTAGVLSHTFMGAALTKTWLNGRLMSEGFLNAQLCAEFGARLALVSGDDLTCDDARDYAPDAQHVAVKTALDRHTARCLSPETTAALLREAAAKSVTTAAVPAGPSAPFTCEIHFATSNCASQAALVPGVLRTGDNAVAFTYDSIDEIYRCFTVVTRLAQHAAERVYG
jgi:D-amino peptidase